MAKTSPSFKVGVKTLEIQSDPGSGIWGSEAFTTEAADFKTALSALAWSARNILGWEAGAHLEHYLENTGTTMYVDVNRMLADVPSASQLWQDVIADTKAFVGTLPEGEYNFVSTTAWGGYNTKSESWNWFYAIGGYSVFVKCWASVKPLFKTAVPWLSVRKYELDVEYVLYDRYNWDKGKSVEILGKRITDQQMGELHRQGLAHEFDVYGSMISSFSW